MAASMPMAAGNTSYSTTMASNARRAVVSSTAATAAMGWPT